MPRKFKHQIWLGDELIITLNKALLKKQKINDVTLGAIKQMHTFKHLLFEDVKKMDDGRVARIRQMSKVHEMIELELQRLWGFKEDHKFIKFWEFPKCVCPKLDNEDRWPSGVYVYNCSCPIHMVKCKGD